MLKRTYHYITKRSLYLNSLYQMVNVGLLSVVGFFFWLVAAKLYKPTEIGIATTLFSSVMLLSGVSGLGLSSGLLRFIPTAKSFEKKLNSSLIAVGVVSAALSLGYVLFLPSFSPKLSFIQDHLLYVAGFVLFTVISALNDLLESTFIALKHVLYVVEKNILGSLTRFAMLFTLLFLGSYGIFSSVFIGIGVSMLFGFFLIYRKTKYAFRPNFAFHEVREMGFYSLGLFVAGQASNIPSYLLPVIITSKISAQATAYYFIAASIANFLYLIPKIVTTNLLVEGSYDDKRLRSHVMHSGFIIFALYLPLCAGFLLFGQHLLLVFGKAYSDEGFTLLRLLAISGIFVCINYIFGTIVAIKKRVRIILFTNTLTAVLLICLSYFFLQNNIVGVGYAIILTQAILLLVYLGIFRFTTILKK